MDYFKNEYIIKFKLIDHLILKGIKLSAMDIDLIIYDYEKLYLFETKFSKNNPFTEDPNNHWKALRKQIMVLWNIKKNSNELIDVYILYYSEPPNTTFSLLTIKNIDETSKEKPLITFKRKNMSIDEYREWRLSLNEKASQRKNNNVLFDKTVFNELYHEQIKPLRKTGKVKNNRGFE